MPDGGEVLLGGVDDGWVRWWEPAHGAVTAKSRDSYRKQEPGSRAYASAGLPGADGESLASPGTPGRDAIDLDEVALFVTEKGIWPDMFGSES